MPDPRVTQQDVARAARVHRTTVSLALADSPRIPVRTKLRVKRAAERLGYTPDPMLSALNAYRTRRRPAAFHGTIGWLANTEYGFDWKLVPHFCDYFEGAAARARSYGFQLEAFDFNTPSMNLSRMHGMLRARNVSGLLLCPQPLAYLQGNFSWEPFSVVAFGYTLAALGLHTVTSAHYRAMRRIMAELHRRGYRRPGFSFPLGLVERHDYNILAGFLIGEGAMHAPPAVPPLFSPWRSPEALGPWIEEHRPDVIVTGNHLIIEILAELNLRVPDDISAVCPTLPSGDTDLAGIVEDSKRIGALAVDQLVSMINRGERGVPDHPIRIHLEGDWWPGRSLRPIASPAVSSFPA